jgi:C4-dicarboxylate-binding protein DctP
VPSVFFIFPVGSGNPRKKGIRRSINSEREDCSMKKYGSLFKVVVSLVLLAGIAMAFSASPAAAAPEYKWKFAQTTVRPTQAMSMRLFCDLVKKYSNGRMEIKFYPDGLMGSHDEIFHAVQEGSIEIGNFAPYVNLVPGGMFNWMPWTISSWEEAEIAFGRPNGILYKVLEKAYNEIGMHTLYTNSQGPYGLGNNVREIKTPADLKNLKFRVSSSLGSVKGLLNMGKGTGMTVETISWGELYNALSRGVVDGCWDMWPSLIEERHAEVMKYYTALDWMWDGNQIAVNKAKYDALPKDLQDAITRAAKEAEIHQYKLAKAAVKDMEARLKKQANFKIYYPTEKEKDVFRQKAQALTIWDELCKPWLDKAYPGQNMTQKILKELEAIRKQVHKN